MRCKVVIFGKRVPAPYDRVIAELMIGMVGITVFLAFLMWLFLMVAFFLSYPLLFIGDKLLKRAGRKGFFSSEQDGEDVTTSFNFNIPDSFACR